MYLKEMNELELFEVNCGAWYGHAITARGVLIAAAVVIASAGQAIANWSKATK